MLLKNKTAVITGSNKGIGKEILNKFSESGANIIACSRNITEDEKLFRKSLMEKYRNNIYDINLDLSDTENIKNALKNIRDTKKEVNILVNNASTIHTALFQMTTVKKFEEIFKVNFFSQIEFTQGILKLMPKKKDSNIVFISSTSASDSNVGRSAYSSSKAALVSISKTLARELATYSIRVNSIAPGLTITDMMKNNTSEKLLNELEKKIPLNRFATPDEIANVALFLASELSSYVNGETIRVDGGMIF